MINLPKQLLPQVERYFKAGLHVHTTVSDGSLTPEELKAAYKERGFQIIAFTDHEICVPHPELADPEFLPLTSYELAFNPKGIDKFLRKTYHLCFIAKDPENRWQVFDPSLVVGNSAKYADSVVCDGFEERDYSLEQVNDVIARANAHGFLVAYNHPAWSLQDHSDYAGLKGLWAMEVYNNHCNRVGFDDNNSRVYQDLLNQGNCLFPIATDDFHRMAHPNWIAGGWVMVGAEKLEYGSVISALEKGEFYASTGPQIHSLSLEGTLLKITCDPAQHILVTTHSRHAAQLMHYDGTTVSQAEFDLGPWLQYWREQGQEEKAFVRLTVTDPAGNRAYTRAYWYRELTEE